MKRVFLLLVVALCNAEYCKGMDAATVRWAYRVYTKQLVAKVDEVTNLSDTVPFVRFLVYLQQGQLQSISIRYAASSTFKNIRYGTRPKDLVRSGK